MSSIDSNQTTSGDQMAPVNIPTLQPGDRLSQPEFLRRYGAMPNLKHAELIEGVVYTASPVSADHAFGQARMIGWMIGYCARVKNVDCGDNGTIRMDLDNVPQPDCCLRYREGPNRLSRVEDGYIVGAPELIAEVAVSSVSYDLHDKLRAYQRNAVQEYIVWRTRDRAIDWFVLRNGRYELMKPAEDGVLRSEIFPGLWLDPQAMIDNDLTRLMAVLEDGLKSVQST